MAWNFFGTAGFSALHRINVVCSAAGVHWALVPGAAVSRLLRICDPDDTLPLTDVATEPCRRSRADGEPNRLLQLVPQPR